MTKGKKILLFSTLVILATYFLFLGLSEARAFLIPVATAVILALLMLPVSAWMEKGFMNRVSASLLNTFILFLLSLGFMALVSFQIKNFFDDWPQIKETMEPKIEQLKSFLFEHTPLEKEDLEQAGGTGSLLGSGSPSQQAATFFGTAMGFFGDYLLTFIYVFFLLNYRHRFREFLIRLFPKEQKNEVKEVIRKSARVTQKYLVGKFFLILILAALYSLGLGISGVDNFIMVSILAAVLSLIPYIGNIIGFGLAMAFGYLSSGETGVLIGILITFGIAQFLESYVLEPYIVGDQVDLHPFFVIIGVIIGSMVWGVMGMILSIPILAIINVVLLNIQPLKPFGYLLSNDEKEN